MLFLVVCWSYVAVFSGILSDFVALSILLVMGCWIVDLYVQAIKLLTQS